MNLEDLLDDSLVLKAVLMISDEGIESVDVIVGPTEEAAKVKALDHAQELAEQIVIAEWGQALPEAGVRSEFEYDSETDVWLWGSVEIDGIEVRILPVDQMLLALE